MSFVSPVAIAPAKQSRLAAMASRPLPAALLVLVLITAARLTGTVDSDVAWQLWIAGRMHEGADLYRDIIETNPPLWFWMAVPIERIAALLHVRIESALIVAMSALGALSLAATSPFLRDLVPMRRTMFLIAAAITVCAMPWMHVGQREQIVMITTLPYAALTAARREGRSSAGLSAIVIGISAGLGFALKHYFLIVTLLLELWLVAGIRRQWRPIRPETLSIAAVGAAYAAAISLFEPDFVTRIIPLLQLAYGAFGAPGIAYLLGPFAIVGLLLMGAVALHAPYFRREAGTSFAAALAVAALGFTAVYFIQFKGWPYHTIPMIGFASLALVGLLASSQAPLRPLRLAAPALLAMPLFLAAKEQLNPALPSQDLIAAVEPLQPGDSIGFLATETAIPWSVTLQGGYRYPSRYNGFWMLRAIVGDEQLGGRDPRLKALGEQIVSETVADFRCAPPKRIIVARPPPGEVGFDILAFFMRNPAFEDLLSHYRPVSRNSLEAYVLSRPFEAHEQPSCPTQFINHAQLTETRSSSMSRLRPRG